MTLMASENMEIDETDSDDKNPRCSEFGRLTRANWKEAKALECGRKLLQQARVGDVEAVRVLVAAGAPFTADWVGTSPLHWTAYYNHIAVTEILLKAGISQDTRNKVDRTPLHVASQMGHYEIARLLVACGANVNARDMLHMTPLHWAAQGGSKDMATLLLNNGAEIMPMSKFDKTPGDIAEDYAFYDIINVIEETKVLDCRARALRWNVARTENVALIKKIKAKSFDEIKPSENSDVPKPAATEETPLKMIAKKKRIGVIVTKSKLDSGNNKFNVVQRVVESTSNNNNNSNKANSEITAERSIEILKEHGITMLEPDEGTVVSSAVQAGQTIKLTEAGKIALNITKPAKKCISNMPMKPLRLVTSKSSGIFYTRPNGTIFTKPNGSVSSQPTSVVVSRPNGVVTTSTEAPKLSPLKIALAGKKIIAIKADQLINMTKEKKVIIKSSNARHNARLFEGKLYTYFQRSELTDKLKTRIAETERQAEQLRKMLRQKEEQVESYKKQLNSMNYNN